MSTQKFMGRNQLLDRLAAQVGDRDMAVGILQKRGMMDAQGNLTEKGKERNAMTAEERALDRAAKGSGRKPSAFKYDPATNRAKLRK